MKTILITGATGLVGSACVDFFHEKGWHVIGIDNNQRAKMFGTPFKPTLDRKHRNAFIYDTDVSIPEQITALFKTQIPVFDAIIHAAAQPSHDYATDHALEDFDINARATLILLEATRKYCPDAVFVYISTDKVYGENMNFILREQEHEKRYGPPPGWEKPEFDESLGLDFAGNRSLFGCSKAAADMYVQEYGHRFGMKTVCFRPGCITGKNHQGAEQHGFLAYLTKCIKEGKTYKIFGFKGKQVRDQIHSEDLASACAQFINNPSVAAVYNIGGGPERSVSVLEAGEMIAKKLGKEFTYELHEARQGDRIWDVHDVSKFKADYPEWDYKYSLEDIINDLCQ